MRTHGQLEPSSASAHCFKWQEAQSTGIASPTAAQTDERGFLFAANMAIDASEEGDDSLEEVARKEQEFLRQQLREELKREPSEEELNEYERQHTEGY